MPPTKAELRGDIANLELSIGDLEAKLAKMPSPGEKPIAPNVQDYNGDPDGLAEARDAHQAAYKSWSGRNQAIGDSRASLEKQIATANEVLAKKQVLLQGADALAQMHDLAAEFTKANNQAAELYQQIELKAKALGAIHYPTAGNEYVHYILKPEWKPPVQLITELRSSGISIHAGRFRDEVLRCRNTTGPLLGAEAETKAEKQAA